MLIAIIGENCSGKSTLAKPLAWLPEGTVRILVKADLETIKQRFRARLHGNLPVPGERMM